MVPSDEPEDEIVPDPSDALEFQRVKRAKPKRRGFWLLMLMVLLLHHHHQYYQKSSAPHAHSPTQSLNLNLPLRHLMP